MPDVLTLSSLAVLIVGGLMYLGHVQVLDVIDDVDRYTLLAAAVFGHGMAGFCGDGVAQFGEHDGDGELRVVGSA